MKKYLILLLFVLTFSEMYSQSQGISYQAVIIDSNAYEIPGQDINGNFLPQKEIAVRFTIYDQSGNIDYQETQSTQTDQFGMINLVIGMGEPTGAGLCPTFKDIDWNGTSKSLEVEISVSNSFNDFVELSNENLLFVPYAFHRNITATGTMIIDGASTLKSSLTVANNSPTYLSGQLTVDGASVLNGTLTVNSPVTFSSDLNVYGTTNLGDTLNVKNNSPVNFSGELNVDGVTNLKDTLNVKNNSPVNFSGDLTVAGTTNLNNTFNVNNNSTTNLSGILNVSNVTWLNNDLNVAGISNFNGALNVQNSNPALFTGDITVNGKSNLNNQLIVNADLNGSQTSKNSYPLRVEGSNQGIAISIDVSRNSSNNFITFWDTNGIQGNIEGQTTSELHNSFDYIWNQTYQALMTSFQTAAVIADLVGIDDADMAVVEGAELVTAIAEWGKQNIELENNVGISFNSGGADYAEYLEKENPQEQFSYGDIVGVKGGKISKTMEGHDNYMVISKNPVVLGNLPPENKKQNFEKVAFMGQVLVKVIGVVKIGDYIIATDRNDGIGKAINPNDIKPEEYDKIVGVAWSESNQSGLSMINVAVGINTNFTANIITQYQEHIKNLEDKTNSIIDYLKAKDPNFEVEKFETDTTQNILVNNVNQNNTVDYTNAMNIIKNNLKNNIDFIKQIQANARKMLDERNIDYKQFEQTNKLVSDPEYAIKILEESGY